MISVLYQFNLKLNFKQKIIILSNSLILAAFILIFFLLAPNIRGIKILHSELDRRRQEVQSLIQLNSTPFLLEQQLSELEAKMTGLYSSLLIKGYEINFIQFLENFSRQYNVKQTINLSPIISPSADLSLTLQGAFSDFLKYLIALDSSPYYINITSINVSSIGARFSASYSPQALPSVQSDAELTVNEPAEPFITAQINAKVFWQYE